MSASSTPTKTPLTHQEQQQEYARRLSTIGSRIRLVEIKLIAALNGIRSQLQDIDRECAEAEKIVDQDKEAEMPPLKRVESSFSEGSGEGEGGVYFVVDDEEKYAEILKFIIEEEMDALRSEISKAKAAEAAKSGERVSKGAE